MFKTNNEIFYKLICLNFNRICKGPDWKPGIFVQFTKDVGVARDAGLRPGDQVLSCNDVDFSDILFSDVLNQVIINLIE